MNRRQFFIALAALAVLAALGAAVVLSERSAWTAADSRAGQKAIAGLRLSEVAEIAIVDPAGELHLVRGESGWSVRERAGFAAETDRIAALLVKLAELKIVQSEPLPASQRARLELLEPKGKVAGAGTLIELKDAKGGSLGRLLLGKKIVKSSPVASLSRGEAEATGRYLVAGGEAGTVLAVGEPLTEVESKPEQWLVKDLLRADGAKSISSSKDGKQRWSVARETESADWKFAGSKERPDLQKATDLASSLGWVNLVDVVADPAKADTGLDHAIVIKADTFDGLSYVLRVGKQVGDNYYVKVAVAGEPRKTRTPAKGEKADDKAKNDQEFEERRKKLLEKLERERRFERWTYLVAKNGLDPLLRDRAGLMPEKKKSAKKT
ncbi:MAG: DUF4340 domain-containing protein [Betaproteobacteria bacterium]|nr:MAG: DUF4340 domain-containing protein [Betaproteobacteria bacterium]